MKDEIYIVISKATDPSLSFGEAIRASVSVANSFKSAYHLALTISGINDPKLGYRASLERVNNEYAVQLEDRLGPQKATVARVKRL